VTIDIQIVTGHDGASLALHGPAVDEAEAARLMTDKQIVRHRHIRQQIDFLIDGADPQLLGVGGIGGIDGDAVEFDTASIPLIDPSQRLDQSGFTGAIFTELKP
jgi:hypothetical protein